MAKFGCPLVSDEEITVAAEALSRGSNHAIQGNGARNLAYAALVAVRAAHFDEAAELKVFCAGRPNCAKPHMGLGDYMEIADRILNDEYVGNDPTERARYVQSLAARLHQTVQDWLTEPEEK